MKRIFLLLLLPVSIFYQQNDPVIQARIKTVENSLSPGVIYGDSLLKLNHEQRMKETGTKGLSIALIKNYQVEWTKGYGWADVEEQ